MGLFGGRIEKWKHWWSDCCDCYNSGGIVVQALNVTNNYIMRNIVIHGI